MCKSSLLETARCCEGEVPSYPLGVPQRYKHSGKLGLTYVTRWGFLDCSREKRGKKGKTLTISQPRIPTSEISERPEVIWAEKCIPCYTHVLCSKNTKTSVKHDFLLTVAPCQFIVSLWECALVLFPRDPPSFLCPALHHSGFSDARTGAVHDLSK